METKTGEQLADKIMLPFEQKVTLFIDNVFGGEHHLRKVENHDRFWLLFPHGTLATFDGNSLTSIVFWAHELGLRAEIDTNGMHGLKLYLHNRTSREGRLYERHPTLDDVFHAFTKHADNA